jgi:acetoin utilization deacetylase AcuC-like enzyme
LLFVLFSVTFVAVAVLRVLRVTLCEEQPFSTRPAVNVYYSPAYVGAAHAFDTTRKARWIADSLGSAPIEGVELSEPTPLTAGDVAAVHDPAYVRAVQSGVPRGLAESQGFAWDAGLWPMVLASNGGVADAAVDAMRHGVSGSLSSGLHHARRDIGEGFCTFNGLVIAARRALAEGAESVLILDLDAHCGGGTASMIAGESRIWQLDVSVDSYDRYEPTERARLHVVSRGADYLDTIERGLRGIGDAGPRFALCLYNAGMDPFELCDTGGSRGITRDILATRERIVFDWCTTGKLPVAFVMAGGYTGARLDQETLVGLHRSTLSAAAECGLGGIVRRGIEE